MNSALVACKGVSREWSPRKSYYCKCNTVLHMHLRRIMARPKIPIKISSSLDLPAASVRWKHDTSRPYLDRFCVQSNMAELRRCLLEQQLPRRILSPCHGMHAPESCQACNPEQRKKKNRTSISNFNFGFQWARDASVWLAQLLTCDSQTLASCDSE